MDCEDTKTAEFLWNASRLIRTNPILQCHYVSKCRRLEETEGAAIPARLFRNTAICKHCSNVWMYGRNRVAVMPKTMPGKRMRKIIQKHETSPSQLRPIEKSLFEKYKKEKDNKLVLKCLVCKKNTLIPLKKPIKVKPVEIDSHVHETPSQSKKKKKKKKRDVFAGLNSSVVSVYSAKKEPALEEKIKRTEGKFVVTKQMESPKKIARKNDAQDSRQTVWQQIQDKKQKIIEEMKEKKKRPKKAKSYDALQKILTSSSSISSGTKPSLKDFLATLN